MSAQNDGLAVLLRALRLGEMASTFEELAQKAEQEGWRFTDYLGELAQQELSARKRRRIERNLKASGLPTGKTLATLKLELLPLKVRRQLASLLTGDFLKTATNVLTFGHPGRGKTHLSAAIGHELIRLGHRVLFVSTYKLVQRLLVAKRELELERALKRLDGFDAIILDDLGYIQQDRDEMEVLFTFISERYERRSILLTSNLVFSKWDRIFRDPMITNAAIDRLVHHSVVLELTGPSIRSAEAGIEQKTQVPEPQ